MKPHLPLILVAALSIFPAFGDVTYTEVEETAKRNGNNANIVVGTTKVVYDKYEASSDDDTVSLGTDTQALDITKKNLYFGGEHTITINGAKIENTLSVGTDGSTYTPYAFIVETDVVIDDVDMGDIKNNICVGTRVDNGHSSTLTLQNGAKLTTTGFYNSVGGTNGTAAINISGSGSVLSTQQMTIGNSVCQGLPSFTVANEPTAAGGNMIWAPRYLCDDAAYATARSKPSSETIAHINITEGGKMIIGENSTGTSHNKLQIYNGKVTVDGDGSSLEFGGSAGLRMNAQANLPIDNPIYATMHAQNGGKIINSEGCKIASGVVGRIYDNGPSVQSLIIAESGGQIDLALSGSLYLGYDASSAENPASSNIKLKATGEDSLLSFICDDELHLGVIGATKTAGGAMDVTIEASEKGKIVLKTSANSEDDSWDYLGLNSTANDASTVNINVATGAQMELEAATFIAANKNVHFNVTGEGSKLTTTTTSGNGTTITEGTATIGKGATWVADKLVLGNNTTLENNGTLTGTVTTADGATGVTIKGSGTFSALTVAKDTKLVVGNSPGLQTFDTALTLSDGSTTVFSVAGLEMASVGNAGWDSGTYSTITMGENATLTIEGGAKFVIAFGGTELLDYTKVDANGSLTQEFTLQLITGAGTLQEDVLEALLTNTTFQLTDEAAGIPNDGNKWSISVEDATYANTDGHLVLTGKVTATIPEPTTATLSLLALAGLATRRRRR